MPRAYTYVCIERNVLETWAEGCPYRRQKIKWQKNQKGRKTKSRKSV